MAVWSHVRQRLRWRRRVPMAVGARTFRLGLEIGYEHGLGEPCERCGNVRGY